MFWMFFIITFSKIRIRIRIKTKVGFKVKVKFKTKVKSKMKTKFILLASLLLKFVSLNYINFGKIEPSIIFFKIFIL